MTAEKIEQTNVDQSQMTTGSGQDDTIKKSPVETGVQAGRKTTGAESTK